MKTTVGVFFGGRSVEHEISVLTALQAIRTENNARTLSDTVSTLECLNTLIVVLCFCFGLCHFQDPFYQIWGMGSRALQTSSQESAPEARNSSSGVSSTALAALPAAG